MQADHPDFDPTQPIQVCSLATLARRERPKVDLLVIDECHLRSKVVTTWLKDPSQARLWVIAFSATPWAEGLADIYTDGLILGASHEELTEAKVLVPVRIFSPSQIDVAGVSIRGGDFAEDELAERASTPKLIGDIEREWFRLGENRQTILCAVNRATARLYEQRFRESGVACEYIDAYVPRNEREAIFDRFRRCDTRIICSIATLEVGVDLPIASCLIDARPTRSRMSFVQRVGRILRAAPNKADAILIDHGGNALRLGIPSEIRQDFLEAGAAEKNGKRKKKERGEALPRLCQECTAVPPPGERVCPECGAEVLAKSDVEHVEGELIEIGSKKSGKREPTTEERAIAYAELKGWVQEGERKGKSWKPGYAAALFKEKFGDWPPRSIKYTPAISPSVATRNWLTYRNIKWSKARRAPSYQEERVDG